MEDTRLECRRVATGLVGDHGARTLARLEALRNELIEPLVAEYRGGGRAHDRRRSTRAAPACSLAIMVESARDGSMRGYFGIGAEGISKPMNLGNLIRSAHAFGASFVFLIDAHYTAGDAPSDTSHAERQLPLYRFDAVEQLILPKGCALIGVELLDQATELPCFRHPLNAAYVFGPERSSLSAAMVARCDHVVRIPTRFCINLAAAGAIVMYDRLLSLGRFAPRPVRSGGPTEALRPHVHGKVITRRRRATVGS